MAQQVIFYDIPSKAPAKGWSFNPWKVRMVLNMKGIDYKTEFVEYPDLAPTLKALGLPPNDPNDPGYFSDYTSPAIRYSDGTFSMESWHIVHALDKQYPTPSLHLEDPIVEKVRNSSMLGPIVKHLMPKVPNLLSSVSSEYFYTTRESMFGKPLQQVEAEATEEQWEDMKVNAKEIGDLLREKGGPFFLGETVSYADVCFVTCLKFLEILDDGVFKKYLALDEAFPIVYEASKRWLARDD
ncbi:hypothetical protein DPSP01_000144 [Paraphaeosphaeria sporulosa]|uniref:GST N-terminal domain-containing protein n=1 Tax=Paraphaeosphaeria sporulosa TaxID=1460663 RepID=A0A177D056_9PLEO|nr:uncharacterized protein CC84DRAFT_1136084 [Paraphaeosphaeria sporulosa]OAG12926.1 hypothetical protein CC84DRAFT_1136084 [Paraphaeosphaeria sporulosa]